MRFHKLLHVCAAALFFCALPSAFGQTPTNTYIVTDFADSQIRVFNVSDNSLVGSFHAGSSPGDVAVSANGRIGFVQNGNSGYLSVFDFSIGAELMRVSGIRGSDVKISGDGAWVAAQHDNAVAVINGVTLAHTDVDMGANGGGPMTVAGTRTFIVTAGNGVSVVDMTAASPTVSSVAGTTMGGAASGQPDAVAATADGSYVVALLADPNGTADVIYNPASGAPQLASTTTPDFYPWGVFITRDANAATVYAYITGSDNNGPMVQVYTLANGQLTPVGGHVALPLSWPSRGALSPDGTRLYVSDWGNMLATVDVTNPTALSSSVTQVGVQIAGLSSYSMMTQPAANAPQVASVAPQTVPNFTSGASTTITVSGANFASNPAAWLRVGTLDPITNGSVTGGALTATVPPTAASQAANLIVSNPGTSVSDAWLSGILRGQFVITTPPNYTAPNQVAVTNFGAANFVMLGASTGVGNLPTVSGLYNPGSMAIGADASRAYVPSFSPFALDVIDITNNALLSTVPLSNRGLAGQQYTVAVANSPANGGQEAAFVWGSYPLNDGNNDWDAALYIVDANPADAAPTSYIKNIPAGLTIPRGHQLPGALAVTPDGLWAYANMPLPGTNWPFYTPNGKVVVYNLQSGAVAATLDCGSLNVDGFQGHLLISPDGNYLLMTHTNTDSNGVQQLALGASIYVFNIANRTSPQYVGSISAANVSGFNPPALFDFAIAQNKPNTLVAYDQVQNVFATFNFAPPTSTNPTANFSQLGSVVVPAAAGIRDSYNLDITPDGHYVYISLVDEDDVAVIDASTPSAPALMTKIATGLGVAGVHVRPGTPTPASSSPDTAVTVTPNAGISISLTGATAGTTSVTTSNATTVPPPTAFQISGVPTYYEVSTTSSFSTAQVCFTYDPTTVPQPESALRLAHYDSATDASTGQTIGWVDVTVPGYPNTSTHVICGQVSSFSPFVIGVANVDFMFGSLLSHVSTLDTSVTPVGVMRSLRAKVLAARAAHTRGNNATAVNQLNAFISEVNSLSGSQVASSTANDLAGEAQTLISGLQ